MTINYLSDDEEDDFFNDDIEDSFYNRGLAILEEPEMSENRSDHSMDDEIEKAERYYANLREMEYIKNGRIPVKPINPMCRKIMISRPNPLNQSRNFQHPLKRNYHRSLNLPTMNLISGNVKR